MDTYSRDFDTEKKALDAAVMLHRANIGFVKLYHTANGPFTISVEARAACVLDSVAESKELGLRCYIVVTKDGATFMPPAAGEDVGSEVSNMQVLGWGWGLSPFDAYEDWLAKCPEILDFSTFTEIQLYELTTPGTVYRYDLRDRREHANTMALDHHPR